MKKLFNWLKEPHGWGLLAVYVAAALIIGSAVMLVVNCFDRAPFAYLSFLIYLLAAVSLGYVIYTIVYFMRRGFRKASEKSRIVWKFTNDYNFRTMVFAVCSFFTTFLYAAFNGLLAALELSIWYGVLAGYYGILALLRGGILISRGYTNRFVKTREERLRERANTYRGCGILLIILAFVLAGAIVQVVFEDKIFAYAHLSIYATAVYVTVKIVRAVINMFKAKKVEDLSVQAIRQINFSDSLVSVFVLQVALLSAFPSEEINKYLFNSVFGVIVCILIVVVSVQMIIKGTKIVKKIDEGMADGTEEDAEG